METINPKSLNDDDLHSDNKPADFPLNGKLITDERELKKVLDDPRSITTATTTTTTKLINDSHDETNRARSGKDENEKEELNQQLSVDPLTHKKLLLCSKGPIETVSDGVTNIEIDDKNKSEERETLLEAKENDNDDDDDDGRRQRQISVVRLTHNGDFDSRRDCSTSEDDARDPISPSPSSRLDDASFSDVNNVDLPNHERFPLTRSPPPPPCWTTTTITTTTPSTLSTTLVSDGISYVRYDNEAQMPDIMRLITKDLSEPYSIYTYRYFIHNWPKLCFLAMDEDSCVGAIVCKLDVHKKMANRGYIAMLAVDTNYRRRRIGSTLVRKAIRAMILDEASSCDEVVLETEITNTSALRLYENLGFVRDKRLFRYYLNGVDALRLKLWLR